MAATVSVMKVRLAIPAALVIAALALFFTWEVRQTGAVAIDDAYITFSFSKNLATGHGPVYGHGVRVEGYSNFLWMIIVALGLAVRRAADPMVVARVAAAPFLAALVFATYRLARVHASRLLAVVACLLLAANADVAVAYLIGLETIAYAALLMVAFLVYARSLNDARWRRWVIPAFTAVALTRIDGVVPLLFILAFEAARRALAREGTVRDYVRWAAPGVLVYLAWFAWRWAYYRLPLPTTYYAKALIPKVLPRRGWQYVCDEWSANGAYAAVPFALIVFARGGAAARALVLFTLLHLGYVAKVGGDWMPYGRFLLPVLPLLLVIVCWGSAHAAQAVAGRGPRQARIGAWVAAAAGLALFAFVGARTERHLTRVPLQRTKMAGIAQQASHVAALKEAAALLRYAVPSGGRLVTDYGGVMAYYTDAAPIEMWGLCNATIATKGDLERINPIYGRTCAACYPRLRPQFFHVQMPMVRPLGAFHSHAQVIAAVWQTDTIGRYLDFQRDFVTGRVMVPARNQAVYFLEQRQPDASYQPRAPAEGVVIDYPFAAPAPR